MFIYWLFGLFHSFSLYTLFIIPFKLSTTNKDHFGPGGVFAIPALKPFNSAKSCFECATSFSLFKQKYHCRNCGNVVCSNCSDQKHTLKKFGYDNPVRCCNTCDKLISMQNMSSHELGKMTPKALKEYIKAYNLPFKTAIEKSDLVRIIFNTRPISNESESYYRRHKTKPPTISNSSPTSSSNEEGGFSFTNMVQELFTAPNQDSDEQVRRQQQAREQEHLRQHQAQHQEHLRQHQARQEQIAQEQIRQQQATRRQHEEYLRNRTAQSTPQPSPPASSQRASPLLSNENVLSIHDLIKAKIDPASLSVRTLKSILKANFVEQSHVIEKSELIRLVNRLVDQHKQEVEKDDSSSGNEDLLCRICFDHQQNCVFLDCGHMVTCMECAKKLIETKNECPICREPILKLVHVFRS